MIHYSLVTGTVLAVFAAVTVPFLVDELPSRDIQWSGEEYCDRTIASFPAWVRGNSCIDVRTHPRPGAQLPPWVRHDFGSEPCMAPPVAPPHVL